MCRLTAYIRRHWDEHHNIAAFTADKKVQLTEVMGMHDMPALHRELLEIWLRAYCDSFDKLPFGQEFDPITGEPSEAAPWYSSAMLLFLRGLDELERANQE